MKNDVDIAMIKQQESSSGYDKIEHVNCDYHEVRKQEIVDAGRSYDTYIKGGSSAEAVIKAGSVLGRAVNNVEECANILTAADDNKLFVRFLSRLIAIKDGLGRISYFHQLKKFNLKLCIL